MSYQLLKHPKKVGDKTHVYYSIAKAYWENGKNKKKVLVHLGKLADDDAFKIKQALRLSSGSKLELIDPEKIFCTESWSYLDLAVFQKLYRSLQLEKVIDPGRGDVELSKLLEILVLNRCCAPRSKLGVTRWYPSTALRFLVGVAPDAIQETRLYRSLPGIDRHQKNIEGHVFDREISPHLGRASCFFYDLTSSYFEGEGVEISAYNGHSKDHRPDRLQVVLGLLMDERGIPFSWDVFPGNQGDAPTLREQIDKFQERFKIKDAVLVFDRGFFSDSNLKKVEASENHYVTGLRAPQIKNLLEQLKPDWLENLSIDNVDEKIASRSDWKRLDENRYYYPAGVWNGRRTVLLFSPNRYKKTVSSRHERIAKFKKWLDIKNLHLQGIRKDATEDLIRQQVDKELKERELHTYIEYQLHETYNNNKVFVRRKNNPYPSQGHDRRVKSFQIIISKENNRNTLDGFFALVASSESKLEDEAIVEAYRQKYLIESAFREMKTVLKLRPWHVYKEEHIRAHYTICVLAYLLERKLDLLLEEKGVKNEGWTLSSLKEAMGQINLLEFEAGSKKVRSLKQIPKNLSSVLKKLGFNSVLHPRTGKQEQI